MAQEKISRLKQEIATLSKQKNEATIMQQLNVGKLRKGDEFPPDLNVYRQLEVVTTERDELKQNLERVTARWDRKVKRLEAQLAIKSVDAIAVEVCDFHTHHHFRLRATSIIANIDSMHAWLTCLYILACIP